jgi:tetratricopeptide (TPR) repeat protein
MVETNPDSALVLLSKIVDPGELSDSEKADYGYLTALSHSSGGKAMAEDGMIIYTLGYYKDHNRIDRLAMVYMLAAGYYKWIEELQMQETMLKGGLDFSLEVQDSSMIFQFYYLLGHDYYLKGGYREAVDLYRQSIVYKNNARVYYQIGLSYAFIGDIDSMGYYINKAIDLATQQNEKEAVNHYRRNYADILYYQGKYAEVLEIQKQNTDIEGRLGQAYVSIALTYLAMRQPDSAQLYIDSAGLVLEEIKGIRPDASDDMSGDNFVLALQAVTDYAKGKAINLQPMGQKNYAHWVKVKERELLIEEKINVKNRLEQHNLMLTIGKQRTLLYITWGLVLFVPIVIFMFVYVRRKRIRLMEAEEKREVLEKLLKEATTANEEDSAFFKKVLLQQLGLVKLVASAPTSHNQDLLKQVSLINNKNLPLDDMLVWEDLYKLIDSIYDGFYTKMISGYGDILTEKEKQLCCLLCAGFSTKEISVISQQGIQTIYQRKTTIRRKLNMDEKEDIVDFIKA